MTTDARYHEAHIADDGTRSIDTQSDDPRDVYDPTIVQHGHTKPPDGRLIAGEPVWRLAVVTFLLLAIALTLGLIAAHRGSPMSIFDEPTHADYAYRIAHGQIPERGTLLSPEIRHEWSCRGGPAGLTLPPCNATEYPASLYPNRGENYNFGHPPLYYAITGYAARGLDALVPGDHFVTLGRMVGSLWLFAGMIVLYLGLRRFGARWPFAFGGAALLAVCPGVLHASSTITNDAAAVLCGAVAVYLLAGLLMENRISWVAAALATFFATATKVMNALPLIVLAAVILIMAVVRYRQRDRRQAAHLALTVVGMAVAFLVVYKGWSIFQSHRGVANWVSPIAGISSEPVNGSPLNELLSTSFSGFQLINFYYLPAQINGEIVSLWGRVLGIIVTAAPFLAMASFRARAPQWVLGLATIGGILAYPLIVELQVYFEDREYFPAIVPRYGLSLIPMSLACLAVVASRLRMWRTFVLFVAIGVVVMLLAVTGWFQLGPPGSTI
jgi:hypothetical protein